MTYSTDYVQPVIIIVVVLSVTPVSVVSQIVPRNQLHKIRNHHGDTLQIQIIVVRAAKLQRKIEPDSRLQYIIGLIVEY